jgi:hypothetical protein
MALLLSLRAEVGLGLEPFFQKLRFCRMLVENDPFRSRSVPPSGCPERGDSDDGPGPACSAPAAGLRGLVAKYENEEAGGEKAEEGEEEVEEAGGVTWRRLGLSPELGERR